MLAPRGPTHSSGSRPLVSAWSPRAPFSWISPGLPGAAVARSPGPGCPPVVRPCLPAAVLRDVTLSRPTSRSEELRQLAVQLASLESVEDVVTHGLQSLLEAPSGLIAPISVAERALPASLLRPRSRSRSPLPKAAHNRPRGSILLSQPYPSGQAVKSCLLAPPEHSGSIAAPAPCRACERGQRGPRSHPVRASCRGC